MNQINSNKTFKHFLTEYFNQLRNKKEIVDPTSIYFGQIGSIPLEDISYENQLEGKLLGLKELFKTYLQTEQLENYSIEASPRIYEYRFKMDYVASFNPFEAPQNKFGQRQKKKFNKVVDMNSCILIPNDVFQKVRKVYDFFRTNNIQNYDLVKHIGFLRYLVIKQHNNQEMLIIITRTKDHEEVVEQAVQLALSIDFESIYWQVNETLTDLSEGETYKQWGEKAISIDIDNLTFKVGSNTFFQNNIYLFEELLKYLNSYLDSNTDNINNKSSKNIELYDLYCGVGIIGASLANKFSKVLGIDINTENIKLAKESNEINKVENLEFIEEDLNKLNIDDLEGNINKGLLTELKTNQTVIVDPPRTGLQKNGIEIIKKLLPKTLIYISCNPVTQAGDYGQLKELYEIKDIRGYDMFPHTLHVENLMILEKKE